jgi:hypothetical protein
MTALMDGTLTFCCGMYMGPGGNWPGGIIIPDGNTIGCSAGQRLGPNHNQQLTARGLWLINH